MVLHCEADGLVDTVADLLLLHVLFVLRDVAHRTKDAPVMASVTDVGQNRGIYA